METVHELKRTLPQVGRVGWIGVSPSRRAEIESLSEVVAEVGTGLVGDHHATSGESQRQVTLIQAEHLPAIAAMVGRETVPAELLRRNIVVTGINLLALKDVRFRIGEAILEGTGPCVPCSLMEHNLGAGGFNAMRGHGGITTVVVEGGKICIGDEVRVVPAD